MCFSEFIMNADPVIRARGKEYFLSGQVHNLEHPNSKTWVAKITGSRVYKAQISIDGDEVDDWYCSCPYDGPVCKHIIAMSYEILADASQDKPAPAKADNSQQQLEQLINEMSIEELRDLTLDLMKKNPREKDGLILKNVSKLDTGYREVIEGICSTVNINSVFYESCQDLLSSLEALFQKGDMAAAWDMCQSLIELALPELRSLEEELDEDDYEFFDYDADELEEYYELLCSELDAACQTVVKHADDELKRQIFSWALKMLGEGYDELLSLVLELARQSILDSGMGEEYLACLDGMIKDDETWTKAEINLALETKISYLNSLGRYDEAWQLIEAHQDEHQFRILLIEGYIGSGKLEQAQETCLRYLGECSDIRWELKDFTRLMIRIAELRDDLDARIIYLQKLFFLDDHKIEHYRTLKALCPPKSWRQLKKEIEDRIPGRYRDGDVLPSIYVENQEPDKMLDLLARLNRLSNHYLKYGRFAAQAEMERFVTIYQNAIHKSLEQTGRGIYENVADHLQNLLLISGDKILVKDMVRDLKKLYPNRRAMIEILNREFAKLLM